MKIILHTFIALILLFSCDPDLIQNNRRVLIEAQVTDDSNGGIPDVPINSAIGERSIFSSSDTSPLDFYIENVVGVGVTDSSGNASFTSLSPKRDFDNFTIAINATEDSFVTAALPDFGVVLYEFTEDTGLNIVLPMTTLRRKAALQVKLENTSGNENRLSYQITSARQVQVFFVPEGEEGDITDITYEGSINLENPLREIEIPTLQGTSTTFSYQIIDDTNTVLEEDTILISINQGAQDYAFSY